jgi:hypothetical protein
MPVIEPLLTEHQAAKVLNVKVATLRRLRSLNLPPECFRIAGHPRYSVAALEKFLEDAKLNKSGCTSTLAT